MVQWNNQLYTYSLCELLLLRVEDDEVLEIQLNGACNVEHIERTAAKFRRVLPAKLARPLRRRPPQKTRLDIAALREVIIRRR